MTKEEMKNLKEVERLWCERHNALIGHMTDFCKELQKKEAEVYKNAQTPVIHALDVVILELSKHIINL